MLPRSSLYLKRTIEIIFILMALATLGLILWGVDKGFDITDEGYNLLGLLPAQEKTSTFSALQFTIFSRLLGSFPTILSLRYFSIALTLLASLGFTAGFLKIARRLYPAAVYFSDAAVGAWLLVGSFFFSAGFPLTFSYNIFINAWMLLTAGVVFYSLSIVDQMAQVGRLRLAWGMVGAALAIALFIKPTAALALGLLHLGAAFCFAPSRWKHSLINILIPFFIGALLGIAFLHFALNTVAPIAATLSQGVLHPGHQPGELLRALWKDIQNAFNYLGQYAWLLGIALVVGVTGTFWAGKKFAGWAGLGIAVGLALALALATPFINDLLVRRYLRLPLLNIFILVLLLLALLLLPTLAVHLKISFRPRLSLAWAVVQRLVVWAMLLLLPFAAAFGTNNVLLWQMWLHIAPWFGLLVLIFYEAQSSRWVAPTACLALAFVAAWTWSMWAYVFVFKPYRLVQDLPAQTQPLAVRSPSFAGLKLDPPSAKFLEEFDAILARSSFQPGRGVIALYDMPGLVYLSGGVSPGNPWYFTEDPDSKVSLSHWAATKMEHKSSLILINQPVDPPLEAILTSPEIDFPAAYRQLGRIYDPYQRKDVTIYERRR